MKIKKKTSIILTFNILFLMGILNISTMILNNSFNQLKLIINIIGMVLLTIAFIFSLKKDKANTN